MPNGSEALPPHEDCVSKYGCRCVSVVSEGSLVLDKVFQEITEG